MKSIYFFLFTLTLLVYGCKNSYTIHKYKLEKSIRVFGQVNLVEINKEDTLLAISYLPTNPDAVYIGLVTKVKRDSSVLYKNILLPEITITKTEYLSSTDSLFNISLVDRSGNSNQLNQFPDPIITLNDSIKLGAYGAYDLYHNDRNIEKIKTVGVEMFYQLPKQLYFDSLQEYSKNDSLVFHLDHKFPISKVYLNGSTSQFKKPILISYCDFVEIKHGKQLILTTNAHSYKDISFCYESKDKLAGRELRKFKRLLDYILETLNEDKK